MVWKELSKFVHVMIKLNKGFMVIPVISLQRNVFSFRGMLYERLISLYAILGYIFISVINFMLFRSAV